ncbi:InlB B-repeat-containing protein [Candidatus Saccharibacteria bacterium]|nr:InlB B-repeat-containing protein [Candidatus Saccharibacteria bacterium]
MKSFLNKNKKFCIGGARNAIFGTARRWSGFRIVCGLMVMALFLTIIIPVALHSSEKESFADSGSSRGVVDIRFLNVHNNAEIDNVSAIRESNLIRTIDNKYVLIDTGSKNAGIRKVIKGALDNYQNGGNSGSVVIDYLIISHLDADHFGNAADLINDKNIKVKNVIMKYEGTTMAFVEKDKNAFDNIFRALKKEGATLYTNGTSYKVDGEEVQKYAHYVKMNTEGTGNAVIKVGNYLNLYFYNTKDAFSGKTCENGYVVNFTRSMSEDSVKRLLKDSKGNYLRIDNSNGDYPNVKVEKTKELKTTGERSFNNYYYAYIIRNDDGSFKKVSSCSSNPNAYGVLAEIKTDVGNKYAYFSNDIDNSGYGILPTTENVTYYSTQSGKNVTVKNHKVYGNGLKELYASTDFNDIYNKKLIKNQNKTYSETKVAFEVMDKIGSDNKKDLVIFQASHHGINNAPDAIDILGANRKDIYVVVNRGVTMKNRVDIFGRRTYDYTFSNVVKEGSSANGFYSGYKKGEGVYCTIVSNGKTKCGYSEIKTNNLTYNLNGGSGSIAGQSCLVVSSCSVKVSSEKPTKSGYKFAGWGDSASAKTATYAGGSKLSLSSDKTIYAVWLPIYTLSYDANGGTSAPASQTCNPSKIGESCSIKVKSGTPTRSSYKFLGWSTSASATKSSYNAGDAMTMKADKKLYAVWKKLININTSVNGTGGKITASMTNIEAGKKVTISFTPANGYEIDNVKVNNEVTEVSGNKLVVMAGENDLNIVVTYRAVTSPAPEEPEIKTFYMNFDADEGETGFPNAVSCTTTAENPDECGVSVPTDVPTKEGYVFMGYGLNADKKTVVYVPGNSYTINNSVSVIGIWSPIYTLQFDLNGGSGTVNNSSCHPIDLNNGTCTVKISLTRPSQEGKEFFGWATSDEMSVPEYLPGDDYVFSGEVLNVTLYAIWASGEIEWQQAQDYEVGSETDMIVEIGYPLEGFALLKIDDAVVDESNYELSSGSTVITLSSEYADTLEIGSHTLQAVYDNGAIASTTFTISDGRGGSDEPEGEDEESEEDEWDDPVDEQSEEYNEDGTPKNPDTGYNTGDRDSSVTVMNVLLVVAPVVVVLGFLGRRYLFKKKMKF